MYTREAFAEQWALTMNNLAMAFKANKLGDQAHNLETAIHIWRQIISSFPSSPEQSYYINNLSEGIVERYHLTGNSADLEEAIRSARQRLDFFKYQGNISGVASVFYQLGTLAQDQRHSEEAKQFYQESLSLAQQLGDLKGAAATLHQLGIIAQQRENYTEARQFYQQSMEAFQRQGNIDEAVSVLHRLETLDSLIQQRYVNGLDPGRWR